MDFFVVRIISVSVVGLQSHRVVVRRSVGALVARHGDSRGGVPVGSHVHSVRYLGG